jgi:argininosuccinate synthase
MRRSRGLGDVYKRQLYNHKIATYSSESTFDQRMAKGFVELWGIQSTEAIKLQKKLSEKI